MGVNLYSYYCRMDLALHRDRIPRQRNSYLGLKWECPVGSFRYHVSRMDLALDIAH